MKEPLQFHMVTPEEAQEAERDAALMREQEQENICPCEKPDENYLLDIESGQVGLRHQACGKRPRLYDDWEDDCFGEEIPVRVQVATVCNCNPYVTMGHECGPEIHITPRPS